MGKGISKRAKKQIFNILFLLVLIGVTLFILFRSNRELNFSDIGKFIKRPLSACCCLSSSRA